MASNFELLCCSVCFVQGKGYVIGGSLANALLAITYQMAAVGCRDFLPESEQVKGPAAGGGSSCVGGLN